MDEVDPFLTSSRNIDFHLQCMFPSYSKEDPPPSCQVKQMPVTVLHQIFSVASAMVDPTLKHTNFIQNLSPNPKEGISINGFAENHLVGMIDKIENKEIYKFIRRYDT